MSLNCSVVVVAGGGKYRRHRLSSSVTIPHSFEWKMARFWVGARAEPKSKTKMERYQNTAYLACKWKQLTPTKMHKIYMFVSTSLIIRTNLLICFNIEQSLGVFVSNSHLVLLPCSVDEFADQTARFRWAARKRRARSQGGGTRHREHIYIWSGGLRSFGRLLQALKTPPAPTLGSTFFPHLGYAYRMYNRVKKVRINNIL